MRYLYILDSNNNLSSLELEENCEFITDVFPMSDWIWLPETKESKQIRSGFFGNSLNVNANKYTILHHLKIIIERKKLGWKAYQIKGLSKELLNELNEKFGIVKEDFEKIM